MSYSTIAVLAVAAVLVVDLAVYRTLMVTRPVFCAGFSVPEPATEATEATAGSSRTTAVSASCISARRVKETSCGASVVIRISPVSCCGRKPLGMTT